MALTREPKASKAALTHADASIHRAQSHLQQGFSDTSHGVRCLLTKQAEVIVVAPVCLTDTIRSQGFSPSQRLNPTSAVRLYFAPLPPIGFRPSELLPLDQP
jgi:UDP-N-acetylglucosamine 2-epimerase